MIRKAILSFIATAAIVGGCHTPNEAEQAEHGSCSSSCGEARLDEWIDGQCPGGASVRVTIGDDRSFDFTCDDVRDLVNADPDIHGELDRVYAALFAARDTGESSNLDHGVGEARQSFLSPVGAAFCGLFTLGFGLFMSRGVCSYPRAENPARCRDVADIANVVFTVACVAPW